MEEGMLIRVAMVMQLFSSTWLLYNTNNYRNNNINKFLMDNGLNYEFVHEGIKKPGDNTFVDNSYATEQYIEATGAGESVNKPKDDAILISKGGAVEPAGYFSKSTAPLGMRAIKSLIKLARALKYLENAIELYKGDKKGKTSDTTNPFELTFSGAKTNPPRKLVDEDYFWALIPYVVSHRLHGTRIHSAVYDNYLNTQDWAMNVVEKFRKDKYKIWDSAVTSMENALNAGVPEIEEEVHPKSGEVLNLVFGGKFKQPVNKKKPTEKDFVDGIYGYANAVFWETFEKETGMSKDEYIKEKVYSDPILYQLELMFQELVSPENIRKKFRGVSVEEK
jgi:hypothetical protein